MNGGGCRRPGDACRECKLRGAYRLGFGSACSAAATVFTAQAAIQKLIVLTARAYTPARACTPARAYTPANVVFTIRQGEVFRLFSQGNMQKVITIVCCLIGFSCAIAVGHFQLIPFNLIQGTGSFIGNRIPVFKNAHGKQRLESTNGPFDIVMLGDSITAFGDWTRLLPGTNVGNHGIPGHGVSHVRNRIRTTVRAKPRIVFLMIGINDINRGKPVPAILHNYRELLKELSDGEILIVAQSILMTTRHKTNEKIGDANQQIADLCAQFTNCRYLDLNPVLAPDGMLMYTNDGIHLTRNAYKRWSRAMAHLTMIVDRTGGKQQPPVYPGFDK